MKQRGFSLIELIVAVAVLGILASVAFPAYTGYVRPTRRADAAASLVTLANAMERRHAETNTYEGMASGSGTPNADIFRPNSVVAQYYDVYIKEASAMGYTVAATPKGPQAGDSCGELTLTDSGERGAAVADCW